MKKKVTPVMVIFLLVSFLTSLQTLGKQREGSMSVNKRIYTTKRADPAPPVVDGRVSDPVWESVPWSGDFIQREPDDGGEPSHETVMKILYDADHLYVAVRAFDPEPGKIEKRLARRDHFAGDWVEINIDSYFDHRTAFSFTVTVAGGKGDEAISNNGDRWDSSWNPIWHARTNVDEKGWTAEMKIPFSQLRFGNKEEQVWGIQLTRRLFRKDERSTWQHIPRNAGGWVHLFGELRGIKNINSKRQVELTPYSVGKYQTFEEEIGNPFATGRSSGLNGGLDGKIGVTSDLTLDFTINPDFGQVEADPSEVNLTAFETFFPEKRPFFIEGKNILNFQITSGDGGFSRDNLFYSRRIGRTPHYYPDTGDDEYVKFPTNTKILAAAKLTGKTKKGLSVAVMESLTAKENAQIDFLGQRRNETAEPFTNYFSLRMQQDYRNGDTRIGGMFTSTHRNLSEDHLDFLHGSAYTGGVDISHGWKDKTYFFRLKPFLVMCGAVKRRYWRPRNPPAGITSGRMRTT
ncbi:MAG: carbohydrate binding family 9 domain-containing protein [bacterium]|nr:carbohydrate binding family 9 domain-containing protein [bacterium]